MKSVSSYFRIEYQLASYIGKKQHLCNMHFVILLFLGLLALIIYFMNQNLAVKTTLRSSFSLIRILIYLAGGIFFGFLFIAFSSNYRAGVVIGVIATYIVYNYVRYQKNKY